MDSLAIILWLTSSLTTSVCTLDNPQLATLKSYGVQLEFYEVSGLSEEDLYQSLLVNGPKDSFGEARDAAFSWKFETSHDTVRSTSTLVEELASGGALSDHLKTKLTLPCFKGMLNASYDLKISWIKFLDRVIAHEARHAIHFFRALPKLEYAISSRDEDLFWTEIASLKRQDREYDHQTRHGASEGARLGRVCS